MELATNLYSFFPFCLFSVEFIFLAVYLPCYKYFESLEQLIRECLENATVLIYLLLRAFKEFKSMRFCGDYGLVPTRSYWLLPGNVVI